MILLFFKKSAIKTMGKRINKIKESWTIKKCKDSFIPPTEDLNET